LRRKNLLLRQTLRLIEASHGLLWYPTPRTLQAKLRPRACKIFCPSPFIFSAHAIRRIRKGGADVRLPAACHTFVQTAWGLSLAFFTIKPYLWPCMKTTIDLPDSLLERTKIAAARRRTSIKSLLIEGLEAVLREDVPAPPPPDALARLRLGYHLGGQPLTRDQAHAD
jgi:hypothetical protein